MQNITSIATIDRGKAEPRPVYMIVGATPGVELPALLKVLNRMGGQALPPDVARRWQRLLTDFNGDASAVEELEKALGAAQKPSLLPVTFDIGLEPLQQVMVNLDDVGLLLFYSRPEPFLERAMSAETSAATALETWCTASRSMLETIHRYRSRAVLFNVESAFISASAFMEVCWKRFRLQGSSEGEAIVPAQKAAADIHQLIAAQMVVQSADVQDLLDELEASAVQSDTISVMPKVNCEDVIAKLGPQGESDSLKEENELLLLQLHQVQEELESYYLQLCETEKRLGETKNRLASRNSIIKRLNKSLENTKKKGEALRAKEKTLVRELAEARDALTRIRQSLSWRLTKPLRDLRGISRKQVRRKDPA